MKKISLLNKFVSALISALMVITPVSLVTYCAGFMGFYSFIDTPIYNPVSQPSKLTVAQRAHLADTKLRYDGLSGDSFSYWDMNRIGEDLFQNGMDFQDLDYTGTKTRSQMLQEGWRRVRVENLAHARDLFNDLGNSNMPGNTYDVIKMDLEHANVGFAALDPAGKRSDAQMRAEVDQRMKMAISRLQKPTPLS